MLRKNCDGDIFFDKNSLWIRNKESWMNCMDLDVVAQMFVFDSDDTTTMKSNVYVLDVSGTTFQKINIFSKHFGKFEFRFKPVLFYKLIYFTHLNWTRNLFYQIVYESVWNLKWSISLCVTNNISIVWNLKTFPRFYKNFF